MKKLTDTQKWFADKIEKGDRILKVASSKRYSEEYLYRMESNGETVPCRTYSILCREGIWNDSDTLKIEIIVTSSYGVDSDIWSAVKVLAAIKRDDIIILVPDGSGEKNFRLLSDLTFIDDDTYTFFVRNGLWSDEDTIETEAEFCGWNSDKEAKEAIYAELGC